VSVEVAHQVVEGQQGEYLLTIPSANPVKVEVAHQVVEGQQGEYLLTIPSANPVKVEGPEAVGQIAECHPLRKRSEKMEAVHLEVAGRT
jgi:hypothetical protein